MTTTEFIGNLGKALLSPLAVVPTLFCAVAFALIGPFGTFATAEFSTRLMLWGGISVASWVVSLTVLEGVALFIVRGSWRQHAVTWAVFTVVFAPFVRLWLSVFYDLSHPDVPRIVDLLWMVGLISAGIIGVSAMVNDVLRKQMVAQNAPGPIQVNGDAFMRRIEATPDTRLILLRSADHQVEVHTDRGQSLLRMRLSDAVQELGGYDGVRVHRSHWVAKAAVRGHELRGDRAFLHLEQGHVVPVSRSYLEAVREKGLLP